MDTTCTAIFLPSASTIHAASETDMKKRLVANVFGGMVYSITMVVGGPNSRNDYHVNETEEWFYQVKGDMLLKVISDNRFQDIFIREGEMFLLPPNVPHNPCRFADTIGLVMERKRPKDSTDRLRWFCPNSDAHPEPHLVREVAFHCTDLGTQRSEEHTSELQSR